ncbi:MAG: sugar phosphate isomerase/epimerase [bacterium]|nr:sugar phosphate isomerase/epimerase [Candidatus Sumerlaeota bacterium]
MNINQVAAQLYTLRNFLQTPADIADSMRKVRAIGYETVQISGMGPIDAGDLMTILDGEGLTVCATHEDSQKILQDPAWVAEKLHKMRCGHTAYPYPAGVTLNTLDDLKRFAAALNAAGKILRDAGVQLSYHNHHMEFRHVEGRTILEQIYEMTDPLNLQGEIDTYWVQFGGGCPTDWCRKLRRRLPLLHMKDYMINQDNKPAYAEIGQGNLDWPIIISEAEKSGCKWFIVEQDECPRDPFESLKMSFEHIRDNLCA